MVYCAVVGCKKVSPCDVSFFKFPNDIKVRDLWRSKIKRSGGGGKLWMPSKHSKVCSRHFSEDAFTIPPTRAKEMGFSVSRWTLKADAVPTLHLGHGAGQRSPKPAFAKRQRKRVCVQPIIAHIIITTNKSNNSIY